MAWVKILSLENEGSIHNFSLGHHFDHVANVTLTPDGASRQTVITVDPVTDPSDWKNKTTQWIYAFTVDGKIVKIGGTRTGLAQRVGSYMCGHYTVDRGHNGKCSVTNAYVYNTFEHYLQQGSVVKMYAFKVPDPAPMTVLVWGEEVDIIPQVYTSYETRALEKYKQQFGRYPGLSDNSDPTQR